MRAPDDGAERPNETKSQAWSYAFEARSADRMRQVFLDVLRRPKDAHVSLIDRHTLPRR